MKRRRSILWITTGVVVAHVAAFWFLAEKRPLPKYPHIPPPNFIAKEKGFVDDATGEKLVYREFTVSTKLASDGKPSTQKP